MDPQVVFQPADYDKLLTRLDRLEREGRRRSHRTRILVWAIGLLLLLVAGETAWLLHLRSQFEGEFQVKVLKADRVTLVNGGELVVLSQGGHPQARFGFLRGGYQPGLSLAVYPEVAAVELAVDGGGDASLTLQGTHPSLMLRSKTQFESGPCVKCENSKVAFYDAKGETKWALTNSPVERSIWVAGEGRGEWRDYIWGPDNVLKVVGPKGTMQEIKIPFEIRQP